VRLRRTESLSFHANKYEQPKVKASKTERKTTAGRGKDLKPQEKKLTSTELTRHVAGRTTKDHRRKSKENDKRDDVVEPPQRAGQSA
jgi:hypothetical protein